MLYTLIQDFNHFSPELVEKMTKSDHSKGQGMMNPYHGEGSVWTHTMLTLQGVTHLLILYPKFEKDKLNFYFTMLCHDIGKIYTREEKNDRVSFFGHGDFSIQDTINFYKYLINKDEKYKSIDIGKCLTFISNHINYYQNKDKWNCSNPKFFVFCGMADRAGSFSKEETDCINYITILEE